MAYNSLFRQSIYVEIWSVNIHGEKVALQECMALTIPPESIKVKQGQRISKTPTPGGIFLDNYGLDVANISISGTTSNHEGRLTIVGSGKSPRYFSGQDAYFEFRDRIVRYSGEATEPYKIILYDLTHRNSPNVFKKNETNRKYADAWEVILEDFTTDRSKASPFFYPYTIEFTGVRPIGVWDPRAARTVGGVVGDVISNINAVRSAISNGVALMNYYAGNFFQYAAEIGAVFDSLSELGDLVNVFDSQFAEYQNQVIGIFSNTINRTESILTSGIQIVAFPYNASKRMEQGAELVFEKIQNLVTSINNDVEYVSDIYDWGNDEISSTGELDNISTDISRSIQPITRYSKQTGSQDPIGSVVINGYNTPIYSYKEITTTDGMSLERMALEYYGDPDLAYVISVANDVYSNDELVPGDKLYIPVLQPSSRLIANQVYASPELLTEILGRDVKLDNVGNIVLSPSGDFQTTFGVDTVDQSIYLKLSEERGRQVRDQTVGVLTTIGTALGMNAPIDILSVSVRETILQDPRILDVYDLNVIGSGDTIIQEFKYVTITNNQKSYSQGGI